MAIDDAILPSLNNPKAQATAVMIQSLLQGLRQSLPVHAQYVAEEHNAMTKVLRDVADVLAGLDGPAVDRVRERAASLGRLPDLPIPNDPAIALAAHNELGHALEATMRDLDELQRAGAAEGDVALDVVRAHLGPRFVRDVQTITVGAGFIGRG